MLPGIGAPYLMMSTSLLVPVNSPRIITSANLAQSSLSLDGVTWQSAITATGLGQNPGYFNSLFVAAGSRYANSLAVGGAWTQRTDINGGGAGLSLVSYASDGSQIVGMSGIGTTGQTWSSTNATAWTLNGGTFSYASSGHRALAVLWVARLSLFVAVGEGGRIWTTPNVATNWTLRTSGVGTSLRGLADNGTTLVAVGFSGVIRTSTDAVTWSAATSGVATDLLDVCWTGVQFIAVGFSGVILDSTPGTGTWGSGKSVASTISVWAVKQNGGQTLIAGVDTLSPFAARIYDSWDYGNTFSNITANVPLANSTYYCY